MGSSKINQTTVAHTIENGVVGCQDFRKLGADDNCANSLCNIFCFVSGVENTKPLTVVGRYGGHPRRSALDRLQHLNG